MTTTEHEDTLETDPTPHLFTVTAPVTFRVKGNDIAAAYRRVEEIVEGFTTGPNAYGENIWSVNTRAASYRLFWPLDRKSTNRPKRRLWIFADPATLDQTRPVSPERFAFAIGLWASTHDRDKNPGAPGRASYFGILQHDIHAVYAAEGVDGVFRLIDLYIATAVELSTKATESEAPWIEYHLARIDSLYSLRNFVDGLRIGVLHGIGDLDLDFFPPAIREIYGFREELQIGVEPPEVEPAPIIEPPTDDRS